ncbi:hypothetical protein K470DRAFT_142283 [Piedraia hortae CBS 480.64]|uniref:GDP/GTP exchange factor Sec2 N-terminal domain-containing protein n=1 Tax=Piedraia hortae CBS 480.64 TaxID=1314780 RepID=A0A6A7C740_9PEZI|nr:hypothetical protein K470DRAFT_142283 [Piedraia hortae CBS 480.64]
MALRFADYENEIRVLQAQLRQAQRRNAAAEQDGTSDPPPAPERKLSRFGSLMHVRKTLPSQTQAPTSREKELEAALLKEQNARIAAEQRVKTADAEIEELSQSLFQEANEMVAEERRKNAMLLQRIEALERPPMSNRDDAISSLRSENLRLHERLQAMEHREADRRRRLDKLESAFTRIERVKSILLPR